MPKINWTQIDSLQRETSHQKINPNNKPKIAPSTQKILSDFDNVQRDGQVTEEFFRQMPPQVTYEREDGYLQKTLDKILCWQQHCRASA